MTEATSKPSGCLYYLQIQGVLLCVCPEIPSFLSFLETKSELCVYFLDHHFIPCDRNICVRVYVSLLSLSPLDGCSLIWSASTTAVTNENHVGCDSYSAIQYKDRVPPLTCFSFIHDQLMREHKRNENLLPADEKGLSLSLFLFLRQ